MKIQKFKYLKNVKSWKIEIWQKIVDTSFKVGFNQLIKKFPFIHNWCFVLAVCGIDSHVNKHSKSQLVKTSLTLVFYQNFSILSTLKKKMSLIFTRFFHFVLCNFRIHSYERKVKNPGHLNWHASCICLINSILEICLYDIIYHHKRVLVLN